jgi:nucleotide-binding universal stress UspA family protein
MQSFENILVYVDVNAEHHQSLVRAAALAEHNHATLRIATGIESEAHFTEKLIPGLSKKWHRETVEQLNEKLDLLANPLRERGLDVSTKTLVGRPWLEIIREVLSRQHDLVLKDVRPHKWTDGLLTTDIDTGLMRKCPCPVWLVRSKAANFRRIAAVLDVLPQDEVREALNVKVVKLAKSIAESEGAELQVVTAWSVYADSVLQFKMEEAELEQVRRKTEAEVLTLLDRIVAMADAKGIAIIQALHGDAHLVIPQLVEKEHEDLVVMGTVARTGVPGLIIGNTAEKILRRIQCSLLAVKPDGFETTVNL